MEELKEISVGLMELFWKEVAVIVNQFRRLTSQDEIRIKEVIKIVEELGINSKKYEKLEELLRIGELLKTYTSEVITFYIWYTEILGKEIHLSDAEECIQTIEYKGYIVVDGVLIYEENTDLEPYIEQLLREELLVDAYHVKRIMDIDEIIERWMEGEKIESVVQELKECSIEELLENPVEDAYSTTENKKIKYVELDL